MSSKNKRYINIAKACLSAINQSDKESTDIAYDKVFQAIDKAVTEQFGLIGSDYQKIRETLEIIAELSGDDVAKGPDIAKRALTQPH